MQEAKKTFCQIKYLIVQYANRHLRFLYFIYCFIYSSISFHFFHLAVLFDLPSSTLPYPTVRFSYHSTLFHYTLPCSTVYCGMLLAILLNLLYFRILFRMHYSDSVLWTLLVL